MAHVLDGLDELLAHLVLLHLFRDGRIDRKQQLNIFDARNNVRSVDFDAQHRRLLQFEDADNLLLHLLGRSGGDRNITKI